MTRVTIHTSLGDIVVDLDDVAAPLSVAQFLATAHAGLYDGGSFWRVQRAEHTLPGRQFQVIQGGLMTSGKAPLPPVAHEPTSVTGLQHVAGTISMARMAPGSASSEFFICTSDGPDLDVGGAANTDGLGFAAFGQVAEGMDTVMRIHQQQTGDAAPLEMLRGQMLVEPVAILTVSA